MLASEALALLRLQLQNCQLAAICTGTPWQSGVVCWKGKVLAGISVKVLRVTNNAGPASVVRVIDHPEMAIVAETLVGRLNLSGFVGFDFIL